MLKVTVEAQGFSTTVNSLQELFDEIKQYDPDVYVYIQFVNQTETGEKSVSATVDQ